MKVKNGDCSCNKHDIMVSPRLGPAEVLFFIFFLYNDGMCGSVEVRKCSSLGGLSAKRSRKEVI